MKAIQVTALGGPEVLKLVELPEPMPGPGQIRVRNHAVAINFHDVGSRRHGEPGQTVPFVPGTDFAGEVDAVGERVTAWRVGDRVLCIHLHGAYAEKSIAMAPLAVLVPEDVSFEQAACCPVAGLTAYFLRKDLRVGPETVVLGHAAAGSVGCFLGGLLRETGATSIGLVSSAAKAEVAQRAGWTHVIDYRAKDVRGAVRELTGGRGVDVVFDSVAGPRFAQSFDVCAPEGTVVLFGRAAGDPPPDAVMETFLRSGRNLGLRTYFLGTTIAHRLGEIAAGYATLFEGLRSGRIHLPIETVPLASAADAHERLETQRTVGKLVLLP